MRAARTLVLTAATLAGLAGPIAAAASFTERCTVQAPGDACILALDTDRAGVLTLCTQPGRADERWRATVGPKLGIGGLTVVGQFGASRCTGTVAFSVGRGGSYLGVVTLDRPSQGGFPRTVAIRVTGPLAAEPKLRDNLGGSLIVNGDFEQGPDPAPTYFRLPAGDASIPGWPVTAGTVDIVASPYWQSVSGQRNVDLSGWRAGTITQTVNGLVVGQPYLLSFRLAGNPDCGNPIKSLSVVIDGTPHPFTFDARGGSHADMRWTTASLPFVYQGRNPNLQLVSTEQSICGPVVDDIRLVPAPGPTS